MSFRAAIAALVAIAAAPGLFAQPDSPAPSPLIGEEKRTAEDLNAAAQLVAQHRWDEAIRRYQQILNECGDLFVPLDSRRSLPARWVVHQKLSQLDPAALKLYREQADGPAKQWLDRGTANRDVKALERVVADAFCSRPAEQALHLLGDLALERGEFQAAERHWRLLARPASRENLKAPPGEKPRFELIYPDPSDRGELAQAKQILALIFQGAKEPAKHELTAFRTKSPGAFGALAGRQGNFADILRKLLEADLQVRANPVSAQTLSWPTFAGDPSRNAVIATEATPYWRSTPDWNVPLPGDPKAKPHRDSDPPPGTATASRGLAFFPAVIGRHAIVVDAARVTVYSLLTGKVECSYNHGEKNRLPESIDLRVPSRTDARYTVTVADNRIYVRLGAQPMKPVADAGKPQEMDSAIVCLELERDPADGAKLLFRWQLRARLLDSEAPALFEGAPVVRDGRLLVARTRFEGRQAITSVECYDADVAVTRDEPPLLRWKQDLWATEGAGDAVRHRHDLLTLAGPFVVFCTHSGAIIALDAATGRRAWAYRYPSAPIRAANGLLPRDLAPSLFAQGRVFAAPADSDRIFCLDAMTGEEVWESQPVQIVQLLGVSRGRLFVTLGGYPQGIRSYDASRGTPLWTRPDEGDLATYGRGFLTDRWVFWPTRHGLRVLRQDGGEPMDAGVMTGPWGNLAFGEGCLVVATATELWGFVPELMRLGYWEGELEKNPADKLARYRLALARADAGQEEAALADYRRLAESPDDDFFFGTNVRDLARHRWHEILLGQAERARRRDHTLEVAALLREAAAEPFALTDRVRTITLLNHIGKRELPDLLGRPELRSLWVTRPDGLPERADDFLAGQLDETGRTELEERARERLKSDFDAAVSEFPWSRSVRSALRHKAEKAQDAAEAAWRYRQLLTAVPNGEDQLTARLGLIHAYEQQGQREALAALRWRIEQEKSPPQRDKKQRPPMSPIAATTADLSLNLEQTWSVALPANEWSLQPFSGARAREDGNWFFSDGRQTICRSLTTGKAVWSADVGHPAHYFTSHADTLIVAGPAGLSRLRRHDGVVLWRIFPADSAPMPAKLEPPFRRLIPFAEPAPFAAFRLAGSRLFFRSGRQRLLAVDVESGHVLWQCLAPGAPLSDVAFGDHFLATNDFVLLQSTADQLLTLDAVTGRVLFRHAAPASWRSDPLPHENDRALVTTDAEHLLALDLATGSIVWQKSLAGWPSLSGAAPQLRRDGSHLLLLIERNYGFELERWDAASGESDLGPIFLGRDAVEINHIGLSATAYCVPSCNALRAFSRQTGKLLWESPLPRPGIWRATASRTAVLVHPVEALPLADESAAVERASREIIGVPSVERFHTAAAILYHAWMRRTFPVLLFDTVNGRELARRDLSAFGLHGAVLWGEKQATVVTNGTLHFITDR